VGWVSERTLKSPPGNHVFRATYPMKASRPGRFGKGTSCDGPDHGGGGGDHELALAAVLEPRRGRGSMGSGPARWRPAADTAGDDITQIRALDLPAAASGPITTTLTDYDKYLTAMQTAMTAAKAADPASEAVKAVLAEDSQRADDIVQGITDKRALLTALVDQAVEQTNAKSTSVKTTVATTLLVAVALLSAIGWALVRTVRRALYGLRDRMADIAEGEGDQV
jgi:hypothetical protein